jgi:putative exporter of polyketide antibiotics
MELTWNSKALVMTLLFRLLFGGYIIGLDQYHFNDVESALTVLLIYGLIAIFAVLFLLGIRLGLMGIIGLDVIFITLQSLFIIVTLGQIVEPSLHDPLANWWATLLMYLFSLLTLIFAIRVYRESRRQ